MTRRVSADDADLSQAFSGRDDWKRPRGLLPAVPSGASARFDGIVGHRRGTGKRSAPLQPSADALTAIVRRIESELVLGFYDCLVEELHRYARLRDTKTLRLLLTQTAIRLADLAWDEYRDSWLLPLWQLGLDPPYEQRIVGIGGEMHIWPEGHLYPAASAVDTVRTACGVDLPGPRVAHARVGDWGSDLDAGIPAFWARCARCEWMGNSFDECRAQYVGTPAPSLSLKFRVDLQRRIERVMLRNSLRMQLKPDAVWPLAADAGAAQGAALAVGLFRRGGDRSIALVLDGYRSLADRSEVPLSSLISPTDWALLERHARRIAETPHSRAHRPGPMPMLVEFILRRQLARRVPRRR